MEIKLDEKKIVPKDSNKFTKINSSAMTDRTVILLNKSDTLNLPEQYNLKDFVFEWAGKDYKIFEVISCKENRGVQGFVDQLSDEIKRELLTDTDDAETYSLITKARHRIELEKCVEHLERFCRFRRSIEISCEELRCALHCIGRLTGKIDVEEILDVLFRDFCIGK